MRFLMKQCVIEKDTFCYLYGVGLVDVAKVIWNAQMKVILKVD